MSHQEFYRDQLRQLKFFLFFWIHQENLTGRKIEKIEAFGMWRDGCAIAYRKNH
jgi:hypothetical protein